MAKATRKHDSISNLDEYRMNLTKQVDAFCAAWTKNNKRNPKDWPAAFTSDDTGTATEQWDEQFRAFMGWD